jgi:hypothetical protein
LICFEVQSSSSDRLYVVTGSRGDPPTFECECHGYYYRQDCRHVTACKEALTGGIRRMYFQLEEVND